MDVSKRLHGQVPLVKKMGGDYSTSDRVGGSHGLKRLPNQSTVTESVHLAHSSIEQISEVLRNQASKATEGHQSRSSHGNMQGAQAPLHAHDMRTPLNNLPYRSVSSAGMSPYPGLLTSVSCPPTMAMSSSFLQYPTAIYPPGSLTPSVPGDIKPIPLGQYSGVAGPHAAFPTDWSKYKTPLINRNYLELAMLVCNTFRGKLFPCPHCRYVTDRRNNLKRHISTMHQACDKVLECCGVHFNTKASLREHIMIFHHNGYSCPYCGRRFCRKALLKRHLSVHSGQKDYSCPHCDYATSHKSNLERHKRIHDRLKNFDEGAIIDVENLHDTESDSEYIPEAEVVDIDDGELSDNDELNVTEVHDLQGFHDAMPSNSSETKFQIDEQLTKAPDNYGPLDLCTTSH